MRFPFSKQVYVRLSDDESALICSTKYGPILSKTITVPLQKQPEPELTPKPSHYSWRNGRLRYPG